MISSSTSQLLCYHGYQLDDPTTMRHASLQSAANSWGAPAVADYLDVIINRCIRRDAKATLQSDRNYVSRLSAADVVSIDDTINSKKICNGQTGVCGITSSIDEVYTMHGLEIHFFTITTSDIDDVLQLMHDLSIIAIDIADDIVCLLEKYPGLVVGIRIDSILQGICVMDITDYLETRQCVLVYFYCHRGYRSTLYALTERYALRLQSNRIVYCMDPAADNRKILDFFVQVGFIVIDHDATKLCIAKSVLQ